MIRHNIAAALGALATIAGPGTDTAPASLPPEAVVPLVAVLWQEPEERFRQASVEAVVYEDGTVVLDVGTNRPEWGRLSGADLARLRDDLRELAASWSKDPGHPYGEARLGADSHYVFLRVRGEFRHLSVGGHPVHSGIWRADPSSLPAALVRVLDTTHDPPLLDRHPLLPRAFGVWISGAYETGQAECKWPAAWPVPEVKTRIWPAGAGFIELDGKQWERFRKIARTCGGMVSWKGEWVRLEPEARIPGEQAWSSFRAEETEPPKLARPAKYAPQPEP